jgi:hypothetical protein
VQWWWPETVSNRLPSNNFSFQRRTADTRAGPLRRVSLYHWSLFKKWEFAGDFGRFLICRCREDGLEDEMAEGEGFEPP